MRKLEFAKKSITTVKGYLPEQEEFAALFAIQNAINENVGAVVIEAARIERLFEHVIARYFSITDSNLQDVFYQEIVHSSSMMASSKRTLILRIMKELDYLSGLQLSECEKCFSRLIKYRNALIHGRVEFTENGPILFYYEGAPRSAPMNDEYWDKLKQYFEQASEYAEGLQTKIIG